MSIYWPQGIMLACWAVRLLVHVAKNGEPTGHKYDPWAVVISSAISFGLLWWGGFWTQQP